MLPCLTPRLHGQAWIMGYARNQAHPVPFHKPR
jgi:hypothetical protein